MAGDLHAITLIVVMAGTVAVCIRFYGGRPTRSRVAAALVRGAVFFFAFGLLAAIAFPCMCPRSAVPVSQWLIPGLCLIAILTCVVGDRVRVVASLSLIAVALALSVQYNYLAAAHRDNARYTGNPNIGRRMDSVLREQRKLISASLREEGERDRRIYPAGWLSETAFAKSPASELELSESRCRGVRYRVRPLWHTYLTILFGVRTSRVELWYPGGRLADAWDKIGCRERPETARLSRSPVTLAFVGDVMLARHVGRRILAEGTDYPFARVDFEDADMVMANLEGCLTGTRVTGFSSGYVFRSPPRFVEALVRGGIDIVSLANNHASDGGHRGILDTMATLTDAGIVHVGAGEDYADAHSLRILTKGDRAVGFLAYTDITNLPRSTAGATPDSPGVSLVDDATIASEVRQARKSVDILVVSFHWGSEYQLGEPAERQRRIARACVDAGADVVVGHHPHVLQDTEVYRGKTIAYSLGNFVFDNHLPSRAKTVILWVEIDGRGRQTMRTKDYRIRSCRPVPVEHARP